MTAGVCRRRSGGLALVRSAVHAAIAAAVLGAYVGTVAPEVFVMPDAFGPGGLVGLRRIG